MKFATFLATAFLALTNSVAALQSKPFYLVALSQNKSIDQTAFGTCHEGAGIEALCQGVSVKKSKPAYTTYKFNYTKSEPDLGVITYDLVVNGGDLTVNQPLSFSYNPASNVALPLFGFNEQQYVGIDKNDLFYVAQYTTDTVMPPTYLKKPKKLYNWYICETYFSSYTYYTLSWVAGVYPPQNPTCQKVSVKREFA